MGVPLSSLQGRPQPLTIEWQGEKVTAMLASPWTPDDVAAMLAVQESEDDACPGCGVDLDLTTGKEHQFSWQAEAVRCANCRARSDEVERYDDRKGLLVRSHFEPDERMIQ